MTIQGILLGTFQQLHSAGCIQTQSDAYATPEEALENAGEYFYMIMRFTSRNPCEDCPIKSSQCNAFKHYHSSAKGQAFERKQRIEKATSPLTGESVAQIAKRLGISKNEVRRRKHRNEL